MVDGKSHQPKIAKTDRKYTKAKYNEANDTKPEEVKYIAPQCFVYILNKSN